MAFRNEPAEGAGVARGFYSAIADALKSDEPLPAPPEQAKTATVGKLLEQLSRQASLALNQQPSGFGEAPGASPGQPWEAMEVDEAHQVHVIVSLCYRTLHG